MDEQTINGRRIRGLTLWRPWPWAFTKADKRVENRKWPPPSVVVGGYLALHAGLKFDLEAAVMMQDGDFGAAATEIPMKSEDHPASVIVAVAKVEGYHEHFGDPKLWEFGPYVWRLDELVEMKTPVPCKGHQGLWRLPPDVFEQVAEQMPEAA